MDTEQQSKTVESKQQEQKEMNRIINELKHSKQLNENLTENHPVTNTKNYLSADNHTLAGRKGGAEDEESQWQRTSDESFEVIEKMCDKTASDPNSTLFQYLNSDCKEEIVETAKIRSKSDVGETFKAAYDTEAQALKRLLDELRLEEQIQLENESPLKGVDVTALEDVEAPSRLWENTITNETILQTSPVKMVGLLRPSTIIEEYDAEDVSFSSDILSHVSYVSSSKELPSEVSSSCYESAHDSTTNSKTANKESESLIEIGAKMEQPKPIDVNAANYLVPEIKITEATLDNLSTDVLIGEVSSDNLIDLDGNEEVIASEHTLAAQYNYPESSILEEEVEATYQKNKDEEEEVIGKKTDIEEMESGDSEVSIIEILSDDEPDNTDINANTTKHIKYENVSVADSNSTISPRQVCSSDVNEEETESCFKLKKCAGENNDDININMETSSSSPPGRECNSPDFDLNKKYFSGSEKKGEEYKNKTLESNSYSSSLIRSCSPDLETNKENYSDLEKSTDKSMNFNDTIEEVEYMMKKGLQYLATAKESAINSPALVKATPIGSKPSPLKIKQNAVILSPRLADRYRSPSPLLHKQKPKPITSLGKSKLATTPTPTPRSADRPIVKPKPLNHSSALEMKPFPKFELFKKPTGTPGAHMRQKELATKQFSHIVSPIRAYIKKSSNTPLMYTINDVNKNPNSLNSMHELERESRLYKPNFDGATKVHIKTNGPCSLPKKAYISSEFKCVVDKRTPVTIPGGKQYQRHIETALLPAVMKHEGKMKKPGFFNSNTNDIPSKSGASSPHIPRRANDSVGDLSVVSGDISMYTIKDARKF